MMDVDVPVEDFLDEPHPGPRTATTSLPATALARRRYLMALPLIAGNANNGPDDSGRGGGMYSTGDSSSGAIIADSVSEFSGTQGQDNWYYGF